MHVFYDPDFVNGQNVLVGDEFAHCVKVLRHDRGDKICIIDGKGHRALVQITRIDKQLLKYTVLERQVAKPKPFRTHLMIAPTKNIERMEWLIEKLGELQIDEITFIETQNTIRRKIRTDRLERKLVSALKQSKGPYKTTLNDILPWKNALSHIDENTLLAYVEKGLPYITESHLKHQSTTLLIGPEGDFTEKETNEAMSKGAKKVSLGHATLRTETAAFYACSAINLTNKY